MADGAPVPDRVRRLCERAAVCGEQYIFVSGRWVLGSTEEERSRSLRYISARSLFVIVAEENITITPQGVELRHHRPRPWEEES